MEQMRADFAANEIAYFGQIGLKPSVRWLGWLRRIAFGRREWIGVQNEWRNNDWKRIPPTAGEIHEQIAVVPLMGCAALAEVPVPMQPMTSI
jgi:hypothetical protein